MVIMLEELNDINENGSEYIADLIEKIEFK